MLKTISESTSNCNIERGQYASCLRCLCFTDTRRGAAYSHTNKLMKGERWKFVSTVHMIKRYCKALLSVLATLYVDMLDHTDSHKSHTSKGAGGLRPCSCIRSYLCDCHGFIQSGLGWTIQKLCHAASLALFRLLSLCPITLAMCFCKLHTSPANCACCCDR